MLKKRGDREVEIRKNMRGADGEVKIEHYFKKDEITAPCRLCANLVIEPGSGIGIHEHVDEDEVYIIQKGKGLLNDDGKDVEVEAGDAILTGRGARHAIKNIGQENLLITAIIMKYPEER